MPNLYERSMRARGPLLTQGQLERSLAGIVRGHHKHDSGLSLPLAVSHQGTARALNRLDPIRSGNYTFYLVTKLPIIGADEEVFYIRDGEKTAHEAGAFMALEAAGQNVPAIYLGFTYTYGGKVRFGVATSDLTMGGICRLERPPITNPIERIHAVIQISQGGVTRTIYCDAKSYEQNNPKHAETGAPFIAQGAIIDLGSLD